MKTPTLVAGGDHRAPAGVYDEVLAEKRLDLLKHRRVIQQRLECWVVLVHAAELPPSIPPCANMHARDTQAADARAQCPPDHWHKLT